MRVLLVDDSRTMRKILQNHLKKMGITDFFEASDGREAIQVLSNNLSIDLVFLEMDMPVMDGMECLRVIRESHHFQYIKVIMISSEFDESKIQEITAAGTDDYLKKPFSFQKLKEKVTRYCN